MKSASLFNFISWMLFSFLAQAQEQPGAPEGLTIVQKGTPAGATACIACHGLKGEGNGPNGYPRVANQLQDYMVTQLNDYASGVRVSPIMQPIAKALTVEEKEKVSAYYANIKAAPRAPPLKAGRSLIRMGEKLAKLGDGKLQVQACNSCHGPGGVGVAPVFPSLAGQHASYLTAQLKAWKEGQRKNSPMQMVEVAKRLDAKSIEALGSYFQQVHTE
jgi:cytochrome c553